MTPEFKLEISTDDTQIYVQATGQPKFEIFPKSDTAFYLKVVAAEIVFNVNDEGKRDFLTLYQGGQEMQGTKLE